MPNLEHLLNSIGYDQVRCVDRERKRIVVFKDALSVDITFNTYTEIIFRLVYSIRGVWLIFVLINVKFIE
ncbi:hypothetical protein AN414_24530 [Serratia marcescens]|nr:hypothetical protein AN414_24530 [Serratia marcescens]